MRISIICNHFLRWELGRVEMSIEKNINVVRQRIQGVDNREAVNIVAATKYADALQMGELYRSGIVKMGENRVDAMLAKKREIDLPIEWHFIGTLQSRKVKRVINEIDYLHSLDRLSLAMEIEKHRETPLKCFIQVNVSGEASKKGLAPDEISPFVDELAQYSKIEVVGLMTMAPHSEDTAMIRTCFQKLKMLQQDIQQKYTSCKELSMGMSNDYLIAIEEGATYIRLGSVLFGE